MFFILLALLLIGGLVALLIHQVRLKGYLGEKAVEKILATLPKENRMEHNTKIRSNLKNYNMKLVNHSCPRCGGNLVNRNGKYGRFIGCSNYPKCRFTKKI